jgi:hypothetical protein
MPMPMPMPSQSYSTEELAELATGASITYRASGPQTLKK